MKAIFVLFAIIGLSYCVPKPQGLVVHKINPKALLEDLLDMEEIQAIVETILSSDNILALINEKLDNSPDFQDSYTKISSEDTRALVEEVRAIPEVQRFAQRLRDLGVKFDEALAWVYNFFGWGEPKKL